MNPNVAWPPAAWTCLYLREDFLHWHLIIDANLPRPPAGGDIITAELVREHDPLNQGTNFNGQPSMNPRRELSSRDTALVFSDETVLYSLAPPVYEDPAHEDRFMVHVRRCLQVDETPIGSQMDLPNQTPPSNNVTSPSPSQS